MRRAVVGLPELRHLIQPPDDSAMVADCNTDNASRSPHTAPMKYITDLSRLGTTFEKGMPFAFVVSLETNQRVANGGWPKQHTGTRLALYHVALMAFPDVPDEAAVVFHDRETLFEYLELRKEHGHEKTLAAMKGARYGGGRGLFGEVTTSLTYSPA